MFKKTLTAVALAAVVVALPTGASALGATGTQDSPASAVSPTSAPDIEVLYSGGYETETRKNVPRSEVEKQQGRHGNGNSDRGLREPKDGKGAGADPGEVGIASTQAEYDRVKVLLKYNRPGGPGWAALRHGGWVPGGCCWVKIHNYHNLTDMIALDYLARAPYWANAGGSSWKGNAYARRWICSSSGCQLQEEVQVEALIDERPLADGKNKGMFTAYCNGYNPTCPSWVTPVLVSLHQNGQSSY